MISELWDVVVVPFPFTERADAKRRPALALSTTAFNESGHTVLATITSTTHPHGPEIPTLRHLSRPASTYPARSA